MSVSSALLGMQQAVSQYVKDNLPKDENKAQVGIVCGNKVIIGNKAFYYTQAVDMALFDGDKVYCLIPSSGNTVAIVGSA